MATPSEVSSLMDAAASSLAAGSYAAAISYALQAQAKRATVPDGAFDGMETQWRAKEIEAFIAQVRTEQRGAAGIQSTLITRQRPSL